MYITYETRQWRQEANSISGRHIVPPRRLSHQLPKPSFTPTWLVRTSDMKVVRGSSVNQGYCALSYSWNQSGDMVVDEVTGKVKRVDQGKHRIIFPARTVRRKPRGRKHIPRKVKYVKFEGIIQQICKNFDIKYIWYDQMCINQGDAKEKHNEIHHMHKIYSNAYCTIVLIPEYQTAVVGKNLRFMNDSMLGESEWAQRLWTLEESILSKRLLFVGRDAHAWWWAPSIIGFEPLGDLCEPPTERPWHVCKILKHAHMRTSSEEHDRVFALANLFPDIIQEIIIDYEQPIADLMVHFYGLLAQKDPSILCFGSQQTDFQKLNTIQSYNLPSWAGTAGEHKARYTYNPDEGAFSGRRNGAVSVIGRSMHVTCTGITTGSNSARAGEDPSKWTIDDLPSKPPPEEEDTTANLYANWRLAISVQLPGHRNSKTIMLNSTPEASALAEEEECYPFADDTDCKLLSFIMPLKKQNLFWCNVSMMHPDEYTRFYFDVTEQDHHAGTDYVILSGVQFIEEYPPLYKIPPRFPVIRREGDHHKAIGTFVMHNSEYFFSDYTSPPEQTFIIQ